MRKLLLFLLLILFSVVLLSNLNNLSHLRQSREQVAKPESKRPILRVALVSDSHNENDLLAKALSQAEGEGVNFVIGLGDYTNTGTAEELQAAKKVFDESKLNYFVTAGDHDLWDSRNEGEEALANFKQVFGQSSQIIDRENVLFVILDNSDIYLGIDSKSWDMLNRAFSEGIGFDSNSGQNVRCQMSDVRCAQPKLRFVFAQKTPFHPESKHVMGQDNPDVANQAKRLLALFEDKKVDGFFSGDLHFFAQFSAKGGSTSGGKSTGDVKITTIGAVARERNFQGPRFGILTIWDDYSWDIEDVEIR